jgi:hypothetical protein
MRSDRVVVAPPTFNDDLGLPQRVEDFTIEQFIAQPRIEALDVAVPRPSMPYYPAKEDAHLLLASGLDCRQVETENRTSTAG